VVAAARKNRMMWCFCHSALPPAQGGLSVHRPVTLYNGLPGSGKNPSPVLNRTYILQTWLRLAHLEWAMGTDKPDRRTFFLTVMYGLWPRSRGAFDSRAFYLFFLPGCARNRTGPKPATSPKMVPTLRSRWSSAAIASMAGAFSVRKAPPGGETGRRWSLSRRNAHTWMRLSL